MNLKRNLRYFLLICLSYLKKSSKLHQKETKKCLSYLIFPVLLFNENVFLTFQQKATLSFTILNEKMKETMYSYVDASLIGNSIEKPISLPALTVRIASCRTHETQQQSDSLSRNQKPQIMQNNSQSQNLLLILHHS